MDEIHVSIYNNNNIWKERETVRNHRGTWDYLKIIKTNTKLEKQIIRINKWIILVIKK